VQRAVILYGLPRLSPLRRCGNCSAALGRSVRLSPPDYSSFIIGYGEMKHRDQARQAVKMLHGTMVGGHTLIVHRSMPLTSETQS
jgi:hypothetical protein